MLKTIKRTFSLAVILILSLSMLFIYCDGDDGGNAGGGTAGPGCWVADCIGTTVKKVNLNDGSIMVNGTGFMAPQDVSVRQSDGVVWVADAGNTRVVKMSDTGEILTTAGGLGYIFDVCVNQNNGKCWASAVYDNKVIKLREDGSVENTITGFNQPQEVSVYSTDGSCWVADMGNIRVVKLNSDGDTLFAVDLIEEGFNGAPLSVSVDQRDGSCWVGTGGEISKLSSDGQVLFYTETENPDDETVPIIGIDVDPEDGSCFGCGYDTAYKFDEDGNLVWANSEFGHDINNLWDISVNPDDGTCWVVERMSGNTRKLDTNGNIILTLTNTGTMPAAVEVYYTP